MLDGTSNYLERGRTIILDAEKSLRNLLSEAVENGDYDVVAKIAICAKETGTIADRFGATESSYSTAHGNIHRDGDYPKFYKSNDHKLIVIGWSSSIGTEYEHKAPKQVLDRLVKVFLEVLHGSEPTTVVTLLGHLNSEEKIDFSVYHVRAFLRWLAATGLITKQGHQGYLIKNPNAFEAAVRANWKRLPIR